MLPFSGTIRLAMQYILNLNSQSNKMRPTFLSVCIFVIFCNFYLTIFIYLFMSNIHRHFKKFAGNTSKEICCVRYMLAIGFLPTHEPPPPKRKTQNNRNNFNTRQSSWHNGGLRSGGIWTACLLSGMIITLGDPGMVNAGESHSARDRDIVCLTRILVSAYKGLYENIKILTILKRKRYKESWECSLYMKETKMKTYVFLWFQTVNLQLATIILLKQMGEITLHAV